MDTKLPIQQHEDPSAQKEITPSSEHVAPPTEHTHKKGKSAFGELVKFFLLAALIVVPIRLYVAQPFIVSGASMNTTFANGEYLIVDEITYRFSEPQRGDVIIFRYPKQPSKFFIKRIVGLPNETIEINNSVVSITNTENPGGLILPEPYISSETLYQVNTTLEDGEYFVMGDNRSESSDSRTWGPVSEDLIIGRALLRLFPITRADILPGEYNS